MKKFKKLSSFIISTKISQIKSQRKYNMKIIIYQLTFWDLPCLPQLVYVDVLVVPVEAMMALFVSPVLVLQFVSQKLQHTKDHFLKEKYKIFVDITKIKQITALFTLRDKLKCRETCKYLTLSEPKFFIFHSKDRS